MGQLDGFLYDVFSILTHIGHACDGQVIRGTERRTDAAVSSALCIATRGERDVLRCVYALNHHTVLMVAGHRCDTSPLARDCCR